MVKRSFLFNKFDNKFDNKFVEKFDSEKINIILLSTTVLIQKSSIIFILKELYGLSYSISRIILSKFGLKSIPVHDLMNGVVGSLSLFEKEFRLFLKFLNVFLLKKKYLINIENLFLYRYQMHSNFKGNRHLSGLPVNGQRTATNAKSSRSLIFHNRLLYIIKKHSNS